MMESLKPVVRRMRQQHYFVFEVFVVVRLFALMLPTIGKSLLIQDKICLHQYNQSAHFCANIHLELGNESGRAVASPVRDRILAEAAQFGSYSNIIESTAMVVWSLFVGSFNDNFWNGTVIVMLLAVFGDLWASAVNLVLVHFYDTNVYLILLSSLSAWFSGAIMAFNATAYRYIALNIEEKYRRIKFIILEIVFVIDVSISQYFSGQLVVVNPSSADSPQLRTYHRNFVITMAADAVLLALLALIYRIEKHKITQQNKDTNNLTVQYLENQIRNQTDGNNNNNKNQGKGANQSLSTISATNVVEPTECSSVHQCPVDSSSFTTQPSENSGFFLTTLLDLNNVRQTLHCFFKPRAYNVRLQIYLLCAVLFNQVLVTNGLATVLLQFSEKVYHWSAATYSTWSAVQTTSQMALMGVFLVLLIRVLHLQDRTLIVISQLSIFATDLIRGLWLYPYAFFVSLPLGALTGLGAISVKNKISRIIPADEVGKVFSISSTIEALVPLVASVLYSTLFTVSITDAPGVIYLFSCVVMCVSLTVMAVEWRYCPVNSIRDFCTNEHENRA